MKNRTDDIKDRIVALRLSLQHEHHMPPDLRYKEPDFEDNIKPLVIQMDTFLRNRGYDDPQERRKKRLEMLSFITQRKVKTTYDLTKKETQTIYGEIKRDFEERGSSLMEFIEKRSQD